MSAICPASEVDELTICLLTVFEQRGLAFDLFEALIRQEIEQTGYCLMNCNKCAEFPLTLPQKTRQKFCEGLVLPRKCCLYMRSGKGLLI